MCAGYRSGTQSSRLANQEKKHADQGHLPRHEVTAIHSGLEQQEGLEYGLEAHHIWTETAIGTSAGGSHLVGEQRPLGTFSLPISAVFRRRFATDVQVAACHEIERPAEPVCASVVHIVALGQSLFAPLFGPPMAFRDSAQNSYQHGF